MICEKWEKTSSCMFRSTFFFLFAHQRNNNNNRKSTHHPIAAWTMYMVSILFASEFFAKQFFIHWKLKWSLCYIFFSADLFVCLLVGFFFFSLMEKMHVSKRPYIYIVYGDSFFSLFISFIMPTNTQWLTSDQFLSNKYQLLCLCLHLMFMYSLKILETKGIRFIWYFWCLLKIKAISNCGKIFFSNNNQKKQYSIVSYCFCLLLLRL